MVKALLLGGTGAIGTYLVQELIILGFDVFVTSRSERRSDKDKLTFIQGNARDNEFLKNTLTDNEYDAIVDFMIYETEEFRHRYEMILTSCNHYIFLSSTRVFAKSDQPITEKSLRLLDITNDLECSEPDNYNLAKAQQEDILRNSNYDNWTIVRPGLVYSKKRLPLGTLEMDTLFFRASCKCPVILPHEMLEKQASMIWGEDAAKMISKLVLNPKAFSDDFNVVSHKRNTWAEIAEYYQILIGLAVIPSSLETYKKITGCDHKILSARSNNRVLDNTKILKIANMEKEVITSIFDGLSKELLRRPVKSEFSKINYAFHARLDRFTKSHISLEGANTKEKFIYLMSYVGIYTLLKNIQFQIRRKWL